MSTNAELAALLRKAASALEHRPAIVDVETTIVGHPLRRVDGCWQHQTLTTTGSFTTVEVVERWEDVPGYVGRIFDALHANGCMAKAHQH